MEKEIVKIKLINGRIITLSVKEKTATHIFGKDKFGFSTIIAIENIDEMLPWSLK